MPRSGTCRVRCGTRSTTGSRGSSSTRSTRRLQLVGDTVLSTPQLGSQRADRGLVADQPDRRRQPARPVPAGRGGAGDEPRHDADQLRASRTCSGGSRSPAIVINASLSLVDQIVTISQRASGGVPRRRRLRRDGRRARFRTSSWGALGRRHLPDPARARLRRRRRHARWSSTCCGRRSWSCSSAPHPCCCSATCSRRPRGSRISGGARSAAAFAVQVAQAIVLAACVQVFFASDGTGSLGLSVGGSVIDLLLCLCLLFRARADPVLGEADRVRRPRREHRPDGQGLCHRPRDRRGDRR